MVETILFFQYFCSIILFSCQKQNVKFLYIYGMIEGYSSLECAFYLFTYAPGPWTLLHMYVCTYVFILFFSLSVFALNISYNWYVVRWNVCMSRAKLRICATQLALALSLICCYVFTASFYTILLFICYICVVFH